MKRFFCKPTHSAPSVTAITAESLKAVGLSGVRCVLWDFGGTLAEHSAKKLDKEVVGILSALEYAGMTQYIHSNAYGRNVEKLQRIVQHYRLKMGVVTPIVVTPQGKNPKKSAKPRPDMIKKIMAENNLKAHEIVVVGDQMLKDVWAANNAGVWSVLVERRGSEDDWRIRYLQRPLERALAALLRLPKHSAQLTKVN